MKMRESQNMQDIRVPNEAKPYSYKPGQSISDMNKDVIKWMGLLSVVGAALFFIVFKNEAMPFVIGILFGGMVAVLNFIQLGITLRKAVKMPSGKANAYATKHYFIRFTIVAMVLMIAIKAEYMHIVGVVLGLMMLKVVIYITNLFNNKEYYKNIFTGKEG
jgi:hypothetical protein